MRCAVLSGVQGLISLQAQRTTKSKLYKENASMLSQPPSYRPLLSLDGFCFGGVAEVGVHRHLMIGEMSAPHLASPVKCGPDHVSGLIQGVGQGCDSTHFPFHHIYTTKAKAVPFSSTIPLLECQGYGTGKRLVGLQLNLLNRQSARSGLCAN